MQQTLLHGKISWANKAPVVVLLLQGTSKVNQVFIQDIADHATSLIDKDLCLALEGIQTASWLDVTTTTTIVTIMIVIIVTITITMIVVIIMIGTTIR